MKHASLLFLALALALGFSAGCTVVPATVHARAVAFDGSEQNAGFISFDQDGGGIITDNARTRFNGLVRRYSERFIPPAKEDDGITPGVVAGTWHITPASLVKFQTMSRWYRNGTP